jgi:hypothetical protein
MAREWIRTHDPLSQASVAGAALDHYAILQYTIQPHNFHFLTVIPFADQLIAGTHTVASGKKCIIKLRPSYFVNRLLLYEFTAVKLTCFLCLIFRQQLKLYSVTYKV